jgi:FMN phosphatase YigB (HAD superfamily)
MSSLIPFLPYVYTPVTGPGAIKRVLVASDFLMTSEKEQFSNRRWLYDLLQRPIRLSTGIDAQTFFSSLTDASRFNRRHFFDLSGVALDISSTQFFYDYGAISEKSKDYLRQFIDESAIVIGYELSLQTRRLLTDMGAIYVDVWLHPVRFLDDILFAVSSNHEKVFSCIVRESINEETFYQYARRLKVQYYKGFNKKELDLPAGTSVFVGQTLNDKAICRNGQMLTLLDFEDRFADMCRQSRRVLYSRHPFVKKGDEKILRFLRRFRNVELTEIPAYNLLASPKVSKVTTISSSVAYEALYFEKHFEFWHRPAVRIGGQFGQDHTTIYQRIVDPSFWSAVLGPVMPVSDAPRVCFLEGKDKLRDMLAFYWSYAEIDKLEHVRRQQTALSKWLQQHPALRTTHSPSTAETLRAAGTSSLPTPSRSSARDAVEEFRSRLQKAKVVSFDVFDTLIKRGVLDPADVFRLIDENSIRALLHISQDEFVELRKAAREALAVGGDAEEIPLRKRYEWLAAKLGKPAALVDRLIALEEESDAKLCQRRHFGFEMYSMAVAAGKKVVFTSDTYYSSSFVRSILERAGYKVEGNLFVSSETGKTKLTGRLFGELAKQCGVRPEDIIHVGDSKQSDKVNAERAGLNAVHVPSSTELFRTSRLYRAVRFSDSRLHSVTSGLIAGRLGDRPVPLADGHSTGDPSDLGYAVYGPMFAGFALWVLQQAIRDGIDELYFLSRDGHIVYRICEIFRGAFSRMPRMKYVYASRRSLNLPSCRSSADLKRLLADNFTPSPLRLLLNNRFGLTSEEVPASALAKAGFASLDDVADLKVGLPRLELLVDQLAPQILQRADQERRQMQRYLTCQGLANADSRKAVIDLGHYGSLQASIAALIEIERLHGYYFVTYEDAASRLRGGLTSKAYLANGLRPDKDHPYVRHLTNVELAFLNDEGSVTTVQEVDGSWQATKLSLAAEGPRIALSRALHDGACAFARDLVSILGERLSSIEWPAAEASAPAFSFFEEPTAIDACHFVGVVFENAYSGRDVRYVIHPSFDGAVRTENSLWAEGARALLSSGSHRPLAVKLLRPFVSFTSSKRHLRKFDRMPVTYFLDCKNPALKLIGKALRKLDREQVSKDFGRPGRPDRE